MPRINKARNLAIIYHKNQKYGDFDYLYHLDDVFNCAKNFDLDEDILVASYLHDILEDTNIEHSIIRNEFGQNVFDLVFAVSGFGENRQEKQKNIKEKLKNFNKAIDLKLCDRLCNAKHSKNNKPSLFNRYTKEHFEADWQEILLLGNFDIVKELNSIFNSSNLELSQFEIQHDTKHVKKIKR